NVDDQAEAGPDHPLRVEIDPGTQEPSPYILMRTNLEALIPRNVFYQLVELAVPREIAGEEWLAVWSHGEFYPSGRPQVFWGRFAPHRRQVGSHTGCVKILRAIGLFKKQPKNRASTRILGELSSQAFPDFA